MIGNPDRQPREITPTRPIMNKTFGKALAFYWFQFAPFWCGFIGGVVFGKWGL